MRVRDGLSFERVQPAGDRSGNGHTVLSADVGRAKQGKRGSRCRTRRVQRPASPPSGTRMHQKEAWRPSEATTHKR